VKGGKGRYSHLLGAERAQRRIGRRRCSPLGRYHSHGNSYIRELPIYPHLMTHLTGGRKEMRVEEEEDSLKTDGK